MANEKKGSGLFSISATIFRLKNDSQTPWELRRLRNSAQKRRLRIGNDPRPLFLLLLLAGAVAVSAQNPQADPLRGVVRLQKAGDRDVDVVVGRHQWQRDLLGRAVPSRVLDEDVPVVVKGDLILLKLYAGGHQDVWDIEQLLADAGDDLRAHVASHISALPTDCQSQWTELIRRR